MSGSSPISPPPQALRFTSDDNKLNTYNTSGGLVTSQFAAHNLSLIPPLPQSAVVHDNACGPGVVSRLLLANGNPQNISIHATDIDSVYLSAVASDAERNGWPIQVSNQKSEALSFSDNFFDLSVMNLAIFFSGLDGAKEIYRTLKPGGTAVVNCFEYVTWYIPAKLTHEHIRPGKFYPTGAADWNDGTKLKGLMKDAGFKAADTTVHQSDAWATVKREKLREWAEMVWSYMGGVGGWFEGDQQTWDQAVDKFVELLLVQPGTVTEGDEVKIKGSQWAVIASK